MKINALFIAIILMFSQLSISQTEVNGKIDTYSGQANDIMVNPFFPEAIGEINAQGEFKATFGERYFKKIRKQIEATQKNKIGEMSLSTLENFHTRYQCEDADFSLTNVEQAYFQLLGQVGFIVGNLKSNEVDGIINIVSSRSFQESQTFNPRNEPATGYMLDWYYVEKAAKVQGSCAKIMSTGNGEETYNQEVKIDLDFQAGWNLVKYEIGKIYTAQNGKKYSRTIGYATLDKMPSDVTYIFTEK